MSRVRSRLDKYCAASGVTKEYWAYSDYGGPDQTLHDHQISTYTDPFSAPTRYSTITDELGFGSSQSCIHTTYEWSLSGSFVIQCRYGAGSWTILEAYSGDALSLLALFGWSAQNHPSPTNDGLQWEPVDLTRITFEPTSNLAGGFFGLESALDVFHAIMSARKLDVRSTVKSALAVLKRFRIHPRSGIKGIRRALSGTSNALLAYRFGVAPLVDDLANVMTSHLQWEAYRAKHRQPVTGWRRRSKAYSTEYAVPKVDPPSPFNSHFIEGQLTSQNAVSRLTEKVRENPSETLATFSDFLKSHLRLSDLAGLAWELVPFSFVADWFLHIDQRIQASEAWFTQQSANVTPSIDRNISQKRIKSFRVFVHSDTTFPFTWSIVDQIHSVGTLQTSTYLRNIPHLDGLNLTSSAGFKSSQRQLSAALCWQFVEKQLKRFK